MEKITITIDGVDIDASPGQTVLQAALAEGIYIPHLCYHSDLIPGGHCRVCTVEINGKFTSSCTMPVQDGMIIRNNVEDINRERRKIIEMLFVEGNHFCPFCEKSGDCELQALAYRLGMLTPMLPYLYKNVEVDASHPDIYIDRNRCVLCSRCIRASRDVDKKYVFGFENRGIHKRIAVNSIDGLGDIDMSNEDKAASICPTGCIVIKRVGYSKPFGTRLYDKEPIGSHIEKKRKK